MISPIFNLKNKKINSLGKNILKYRAFEIAIMLYYAESLKNLIISSVQTTDRLRKQLKIVDTKNLRIQSNTKNKFKTALKILITKNIITNNEQNEIKTLIDYRNVIAHEIQILMDDINRQSFQTNKKYNYDIKNRLKFYHDELPRRLSKAQYVIPIGLDYLQFQIAEKTYEDELNHLDKKIKKQHNISKKNTMPQFLNELSVGNTHVIDGAHLFQPINKTENGRLTKHGVALCYQLFETVKNPLIVAYLMDISYKAALTRFKMWKATFNKK